MKFYQTGSFAVGNRLLDPDQRTCRPTRAGPTRSPPATGPARAAARRWAPGTCWTRRCGRPAAGMVTVNATGCLEVFSTPYPETPGRSPWLHSLFGNAPAVATGVAAALKVKGRTDIRVVGQGGDGGTVDIGFGCLSGMFERNDDVLFVCYDNQAYMNTGVQRSGATPPAARTATTPAVGPTPGNAFGQGKNAPLIAMAHEIPYVATATVADLRDLEAKVVRAMELRGARYLHVLVPVPARLGHAPPRDDPRSPGWRPRADCSRSSRRRHGEVVSRQPDPATRCRSRTTCGPRSATPTCSRRPSAPTSSPRSRPAPTATSAGSGCSDREEQ